MSRIVVGIAVGVVTIVALGCSEGPNPVAARPMSKNIGASASSGPTFPILTGAHVSVIPGLDNAQAEGMNDWGEVIGYVGTPLVTTAWKWQRSRGLRTLALPANEHAIAFGVNDSGKVAITIYPDSGPSVAAIWGWFGDVRRLRPLSEKTPRCEFYAVDYHGAGLGWCELTGYFFPGITGTVDVGVPTGWTPYGNPDVLASVNQARKFIDGFPTALAALGCCVVGQDYANGNAYLWTTTTHQERLLPPVGFSQALAVNDSAWAVGVTVFDNTFNSYAALWLPHDSAAINLGPLGYATTVSDHGEVLGVGTRGNGTNYGWLWTRSHGTRMLPGLEADSLLAKENFQVTAVNQNHQVVGAIVTSTGVRHTVIWTLPVN